MKHVSLYRMFSIKLTEIYTIVTITKCFATELGAKIELIRLLCARSLSFLYFKEKNVNGLIECYKEASH